MRDPHGSKEIPMTTGPCTRQTLRMARGEVARVAAGPCTVVRVVRGRVWLTEGGGGRDWSLGAESRHAVGSRGLALVESVEPSVVEVLTPRSRVARVFDAAWRAAARVRGWLGTAVARALV
jgi:hypothetical protein